MSIIERSGDLPHFASTVMDAYAAMAWDDDILWQLEMLTTQLAKRRYPGAEDLVFDKLERHPIGLTRGDITLETAFADVTSKVLLISFRTDWLFPVAHLREIEVALRTLGVEVAHITVETTFGHDAFLTDWRKISPLIKEHLDQLPI